jgi:hypothetical protein
VSGSVVADWSVVNFTQIVFYHLLVICARLGIVSGALIANYVG